MKKKCFADNISDEALYKYKAEVANVLTNPYLEIALQMRDQGMDIKDIKKNIKTMYGAPSDVLDRIEEKLPKSASQVPSEVHFRDAVCCKSCKHFEGYTAVTGYCHDVLETTVNTTKICDRFL